MLEAPTGATTAACACGKELRAASRRCTTANTCSSCALGAWVSPATLSEPCGGRLVAACSAAAARCDRHTDQPVSLCLIQRGWGERRELGPACSHLFLYGGIGVALGACVSLGWIGGQVLCVCVRVCVSTATAHTCSLRREPKKRNAVGRRGWEGCCVACVCVCVCVGGKDRRDVLETRGESERCLWLAGGVGRRGGSSAQQEARWSAACFQVCVSDGTRTQTRVARRCAVSSRFAER